MITSLIYSPVPDEKTPESVCWAMLHRICQKLDYSLSCEITVDQNSQFAITLKVLDVVLSKVTDSAKKRLKGKAAKKALETLLHPAFKVASDGGSLILKIDEEQTVTSSANKQSSIPKGDIDPDIGANHSVAPRIEKPKAETTDSSSRLSKSSATDSSFAEKLEKIKALASEIHPRLLDGQNSEWKCWSTLHDTCQKLHYPFSCDITTEQNSQFIGTLKVHDVILSKVTSFTMKQLKGKVAKKAVETLLHPAFKIISDGENLMLKEDEEKQPSSPSLPASASRLLIEQGSQFKVFPLDPNLQHYFCILDSNSSSSASAASILNNSAQFCKTSLSFDFHSSCGQPVAQICEISLKGYKICQVAAPTKAEAKCLAGPLALDILSKAVCTIKISDDCLNEFVVPREQLFDCSNSSTSITETNVGCKMLKMMGWSGGGIGKAGNTGISEPIKASIGLQRGQGLGYSGKGNNPEAGKEFAKPLHAKIEYLLLEYATSNVLTDLVFATDFSSEERKHIHKLAHKYNLKSVSRGSGEARHLTIGRRMAWHELLYHLQNAGGSIGKYTLITPQQYIEEHSEDTFT